MDAVEIARQRATRLHAEAAAAGHDPWESLTFALAIASMRKINTAPCAPGSLVLRGSRATFVPEEPIIYYEEAPSSFERAFLIAHELGHSELGDALVVTPELPEGIEQPKFEFDETRSSEPPATGADWIVDYGRRQRREVQMDLFARELLLPRQWLRQRYLDDGMSVDAIAVKLGASYDAVAQQMLDALLLPAAPIGEIAENQEPRPAVPPNDKQIDASVHLGAPYLLEAGPGTGKTATLIERVRFLLAQHVDPRRILVLTFSNKAAGEIIDRIAQTDRAAAAAMWVGTFHAFGLDLVRRFSEAFGLPSDPRILDRVDAVALLEDEFPRLPLSHYKDTYDPSTVIMDMLTAISRAKDEVVDAARYWALAEAMRKLVSPGGDCTAAEKALEVALVYRVYEDLKRAKGFVDFGDLVMRPVHVLESNAGVRNTLRAQYDHVLIDEYQDVNRSSVRLLQALTGNGTSLWAVGDARQSIYRFRGASSFNMESFTHDFPGGVRNHLEVNYRSFQEILDASAAFAKDMAVGGYGQALRADRGRGSVIPTLKKVGLQEDQAVAIADAARNLAANGVAYRDQALLCTGNDKVAEFAAALERLDIPVLYLGNLFDRTEVKDLLAVASLLIDGRAAGLLRTACIPEFSMPLDDVVIVMALARQHQDDPQAWRQDVDGIEGLSEEGRTALRRLVKALDGFDSTSNAWNVLARVLLDRSAIGRSIALSAAMRDRNSGIAMWVLLNFLRSKALGHGPPIRRSLDRIRRIVRLSGDRDLRQLPASAQSLDAVKLMTVHGAKGLEFRAVHFPGINVGAMPFSGRDPECPPPDGMIDGAVSSAEETGRAERDAEQECLFYVGLTRAKDHLMLYAATRNKAGHKRQLSPFVARLGGHIAVSDAVLSCALPSDPATDPVGVMMTGPIRLSPLTIAQLDKCRRKTLYTELLEIGGKRPPTPFLKMHNAVRQTMKTILDGDVRDATQQESMLDAALLQQGLHEHGYASDYRTLALGMIRALDASRSGRAAEPTSTLVARIGEDEVHVRPDEILVEEDGRRTFRRVNTGKTRKLETEAQAFWWVVRVNEPSANVEFVFLADEGIQQASFKADQKEKTAKKVQKDLAVIRDGDFPPDRSGFTCPNCPAFFVCGPLPQGTLKKDSMRLPV